MLVLLWLGVICIGTGVHCVHDGGRAGAHRGVVRVVRVGVRAEEHCGLHQRVCGYLDWLYDEGENCNKQVHFS